MNKRLTKQEKFEQSMLSLNELNKSEQQDLIFNPFISKCEDIHTEECREIIDEIFKELNSRQRKVLKYYFGFNKGNGLTQNEIGKKYYITGGRVGQIKATALRILRHPRNMRRLKEVIA